MLNVFKTILIFSTVICLASSCNNGCSPPQDTIYNLVLNVPYKEGDTIQFVNSVGNSLSFIVLSVTVETVSLHQGTGYEDCPNGYNKYMNATYTFKELNNKDTLWIGNYMHEASYGGEVLNIKLNGSFFQFYTEDLRYNRYSYPQKTFNGKTYTNVNYPVFYSVNPNSPVFLFYNNQFGILSFKTDSTQWYLK